MKLFREVCAIPCEDGIEFNADSVAATPIAEDKVYPGARVMLRADLSGADISVQIDVGFGDAVTPDPKPADYPVLLDAPRPRMRVYPIETVVAEKFHAMTVLGMDNSRMKDFYDLRVIASHFEIEPVILGKAIAATFGRRMTALPDVLPVALGADFAANTQKKAQWTAFHRRHRLDDKDNTLAEAQAAIARMLQPALEIARRAPPPAP